MRLLFSRINSAFHFVHIGIDGGYRDDVHHIADRSTKVDEVDGFVQSHLYLIDNLDISIQHLQHLIGRTGRGQVGEYQCVDILAFQAGERILLIT